MFFFQFILEQVTEMIVFGARLSNVETDKIETIAEMFICLNFQVPIVLLKLLADFSLLLSLYYLFCFFFRPEKRRQWILFN